jgi:hypothetical protein
VRGHAEKLDRGESIPAEITIAFENPTELLNVLTSERVRLLRRTKAGSLPISDLAFGLKRDEAQDRRTRGAGIQVNC